MVNLPDIPGWKCIGKLGRGGIAKVYLGVQKDSGQKVAIKILDPVDQKHPKIRTLIRRFSREIDTISRLNHPNIIHLYASGRAGNRYYLVMEYLENTLKEKMAAYQAADTGAKEKEKFIDDSLDMLEQVAKALHFAHENGIIHRDLKPTNIMFRADGQAVLVDFGLAKLVHAAERLTQTGITVGTPDYMSPEQIEGEELDGRADIYSLGVMFYQLLSGDLPYKAPNYVALAMKHLKKKVPKLPRQFRYYQPLLEKMMAKNRDERVPDGQALVELIAAVRETRNGKIREKEE